MTTADDTKASRHLTLKIIRAGRWLFAGLIALEGVMFALSLAHWHHLGPAVPAAGAGVLLVGLGIATLIKRDLETEIGPRLARRRPRGADVPQLVPACIHADAMPVTSHTGELVAWLCPDRACDRQLPATFRSLDDGYALQGS